MAIIWRGTTPTHTFTLPVEHTSIVTLSIIYRQGTRTVLEKTENDVRFDGYTASVTLTQEEALGFDDRDGIEIQVRFRDTEGLAYASDVTRALPGTVLKDGVI